MQQPRSSLVATIVSVLILGSFVGSAGAQVAAGSATCVVAGGNGFGPALNQLASPEGLFVDAGGNVYVAERNNNRVVVWAPGASSGVVVAGGNGAGTGPNQFASAERVSVDDAGNVYVADRLNDRVVAVGPLCTASLTLTKIVFGDALAADFALTATPAEGSPVPFTSGVARSVVAGTYTLAETGPDGFTPTEWQCTITTSDGTTTTSTGATVRIVGSASVSCSIANAQDGAPVEFALTKRVIGEGAPSNFVFLVEPEVQGCTSIQRVTISGEGGTVTVPVALVAADTAAPCSYSVTETPMAGYTAVAERLTGITPAAIAVFTNIQDSAGTGTPQPDAPTVPFTNLPDAPVGAYGWDSIDPVAGASDNGASDAAAEVEAAAPIVSPRGLAHTGRETAVLGYIGTGLIAFGAVVLGRRRRCREIT